VWSAAVLCSAALVWTVFVFPLLCGLRVAVETEEKRKTKAAEQSTAALHTKPPLSPVFSACVVRS
jgi:hypothetical protein